MGENLNFCGPDRVWYTQASFLKLESGNYFYQIGRQTSSLQQAKDRKI